MKLVGYSDEPYLQPPPLNLHRKNSFHLIFTTTLFNWLPRGDKKLDMPFFIPYFLYIDLSYELISFELERSKIDLTKVS